jgi:hypothetical protein
MTRRRTDDEDEDTLPCPYCGAAVYEDAPQCPRCGNYLSEEDERPVGKPWWLLAGVLVCLALVLWWVGRGW